MQLCYAPLSHAPSPATCPFPPCMSKHEVKNVQLLLVALHDEAESQREDATLLGTKRSDGYAACLACMAVEALGCPGFKC